MNALAALVREAVSAAGLEEALPSAELLAAYLERLGRANEGLNLVSRKGADPGNLVRRHLVEALEALPFLPRATGTPLRLLDVGTGGGFPAFPLLIVRRDLEGTLVESIGKKARFLEETARALGLTARVVNARFPDPALAQMRTSPRCDLLTSRAVAGAGEIVRLARPVLSRGATAILWTTEPLLAEIRRALPGARVEFSLSPGADRRGLARVGCFT